MALQNATRPAPALAKSEPRKGDRLAGTINADIKPAPIVTQVDLDHLDNLLAAWRWFRSLSHRERVLRLRFEVDPLNTYSDQAELELEVAQFRAVVTSLDGRAPV